MAFPLPDWLGMQSIQPKFPGGISTIPMNEWSGIFQ